MTQFMGFPAGQGNFLQGTYPNQMGTAWPGMLANAEVNLVDSMPVVDEDGVYVGCGVAVVTLTPGARAGVNAQGVVSANASAVAYNFCGIVMRGQAGWCDEDNVPYVPFQKMAPIMRPERVGLRGWVKCVDATVDGGEVYWVIKNATPGNTRQIGSFTTSSLSGDAVQIPGLVFRSTQTAGDGIALVESTGGPSSSAPAYFTTTTTTSTSSTSTETTGE